MNEIKLNNVKAENQVKQRTFIDGYDIENCSLKIMFLGNSITKHGPKEEIGWFFDHGMAASAPEKDYVHLVVSHLNGKFNNKVNYCIHNGGYWEQDFVNMEKLNNVCEAIKTYNPDILIVRIGENFNNQLIIDGNDPFIYFDLLLQKCKRHCKKVFITSLFWEYEFLDNAIKKAAIKNNVPYIYLTDISHDQNNEAIGLFEHQGVSIHPGDKGMKLIAERIIQFLS